MRTLIRHDNGTIHNEMPASGWLLIDECCTYVKASIEHFPSREEAQKELLKLVTRENPSLVEGREKDCLFDLTLSGCAQSLAYICTVKEWRDKGGSYE
jgi:hypothetical protein